MPYRRLREPAQPNRFGVSKDLPTNGVSGFAVTNYLLQEPPFLARLQDFSPPDHHANGFSRRRLNFQREHTIRPIARQSIEHADAVLAKPGVAPGGDHRAGFGRIKALLGERVSHFST